MITFRQHCAALAMREIMRANFEYVRAFPGVGSLVTEASIAAIAFRAADAMVAAQGPVDSGCGAAPSASGPAKVPGPYSEKP